ncbi:methylated-DNA--[protein]-cysteine S-methyltransferase [Mesobacillus zeae]|uniref:Methylated-DNA--protein-cysteine methyltransferase n=2 Tax=Mesobacillus zeae TaxID=1917180 RepID=A0A398BEB3_9BACI|nr:methylated-DNA--[protein]-cysteine S-methyltransferase [Mesobacillus zeae]
MFETEIGILYIVSENKRINAVHIGEEDFLQHEDIAAIAEDRADPLLAEAKKQMMEYFRGERQIFKLPLEQKGTDFQMDIWSQLQQIPYGQTKSYQDIAVLADRPKAVRAVGQANKANKLPVIVPCHRVIGKNSSLTGYAGTRTDIKDKLLTLEGATFKSGK